jgi:hypothetical protein
MNVHRVSVLCAAVIASIGLAVHADDGVSLKYKLAKGDKLIYRTKSEMKQSQTIMGMAIENTMTNEGVTSYTVESVDEKGHVHVGVKGERLKVKANFGALGEFSFDSQSSERDKSSVIGAAVTPLFERLSGAVYQATLSLEGEIVEVKGYADLIRDLLENNPLTIQFAGGGTDDAAKEGLREMFPQVSKNAVKPGDTWEVPHEITMPKLGKLKGKTAFRYIGPDKVGDRQTAKIEVTTDTSMELDIDMDGTKVTGKISSNSANGTLQFDVAAGRVISNQSTVSLGGTLNVNVNGMDIPVQNEQMMKSSVELLEKVPD